MPIPTDGHCSRDRGPSSSGASILSVAQEGLSQTLLVSQLGGASSLPPPSQDLLSVGVRPGLAPHFSFLFTVSPGDPSLSLVGYQ